MILSSEMIHWEKDSIYLYSEMDQLSTKDMTQIKIRESQIATEVMSIKF